MSSEMQLARESIELDRWENEGRRCREALPLTIDVRSSSREQENESLHRALVGMSRGLLQYASQCQLWAPANDRHRSTLLNRLAVQQRESIQQLSEFLNERQHPITWGVFPVEMTRYNDVALDFLWPRLVDFQAQLVRTLDAVRSELEHDRLATNVLDDIITSELEVFGELAQAAPDARQQLASTQDVKQLEHAATVTADDRNFRAQVRNRIGRDAKVKRRFVTVQRSNAPGLSHAS